MAEMRTGAVTAAGNDEVDGLRRKGGISRFQEWQEGRMRMVGLQQSPVL